MKKIILEVVSQDKTQKPVIRFDTTDNKFIIWTYELIDIFKDNYSLFSQLANGKFDLVLIEETDNWDEVKKLTDEFVEAEKNKDSGHQTMIANAFNDMSSIKSKELMRVDLKDFFSKIKFSVQFDDLAQEIINYSQKAFEKKIDNLV